MVSNKIFNMQIKLTILTVETLLSSSLQLQHWSNVAFQELPGYEDYNKSELK